MASENHSPSAITEFAAEPIFVIMSAWDVYGRQEITEQDIHREMDHLSK